MEKILLINACPRPCSRTFELTQAVLKELEGEITELKLYEMSLLALDFTGMEKRHQAAAKQDFSDSMFDEAKTFALADAVVIAAPYWDLMFPAALKVYLENITVCGMIRTGMWILYRAVIRCIKVCAVCLVCMRRFSEKRANACISIFCIGIMKTFAKCFSAIMRTLCSQIIIAPLQTVSLV